MINMQKGENNDDFQSLTYKSVVDRIIKMRPNRLGRFQEWFSKNSDFSDVYEILSDILQLSDSKFMIFIDTLYCINEISDLVKNHELVINHPFYNYTSKKMAIGKGEITISFLLKDSKGSFTQESHDLLWKDKTVQIKQLDKNGDSARPGGCAVWTYTDYFWKMCCICKAMAVNVSLFMDVYGKYSEEIRESINYFYIKDKKNGRFRHESVLGGEVNKTTVDKFNRLIREIKRLRSIGYDFSSIENMEFFEYVNDKRSIEDDYTNLHRVNNICDYHIIVTGTHLFLNPKMEKDVTVTQTRCRFKIDRREYC